jgi:ATP-binding cassette subfamily B protein
MVLVEFLVFFVGLKYWEQGIFHVGDFVFIQAYVLTTFSNVWNFSRYLKSLFENMAEANEMTEVLLEPHEIKDASEAKKLEVTRGRVEFQDVSYSYNNKNSIYKGFDLNIEPGEKIAIIGPSGGGKSTFVKLLLRFYDLNSGKILVDGQDISKVTQKSLHENIALVPQEPILFHRSVMENIRYAKPGASDEEVYKAAKLANAHEFISQFPKGYDTYVGERGVKLSGGERQRVAIARAILRNAPILLLDEATSSLDSESEKLIQDALKNLIKEKTTIVIAHRLSTVMQMNRIIVLENGKITEQGKHAELLKLKEGTYQRLWSIQAGGFSQS